MNTYRITWENWNRRTMTCLIYDVLSSGSTETVLTPGSNPFVVRSQSDEDVLKPVRYTSAVITVICGYGDLLSPGNDSRYRVILKLASVVVWKGWLTNTVMTQKLASYDSEFSYNAVDDLGFMQSCNFSLDMGYSPSIGEIFQGCIDNFYNIGNSTTQNLFIGNAFPVVNDSLSDTFNTVVNISNYVHVTKDVDNNDVETPDSLMAFLEDFMALVGCTLSSDGMHWYISSPADTKHSVAIAMDGSFTSNIPVSFTTSFSTSAASSIDPSGEHTISVNNQYKKISIAAGQSDTAESLLPELSSDVLIGDWYKTVRFRYPGDNGEYADVPTTIGWQAYHYISNPVNGIVMHRYALVQNGSLLDATIGDEVDEAISVNDDDHNVLWRYGACLLKEDYYNTSSSIDTGTGSGTDKYNYEFSDRLYLVQCEYDNNVYQHLSQRVAISSQPVLADLYEQMRSTMYGIMDKPMISIESGSGFLADNGGLCITFDCWTGRNFPSVSKQLPLGPLKTVSHNRLYPMIFLCRLKVGHMYWDGSGFVSWDTTFYIVSTATGTSAAHTDMSNVANTKTLNQAYTCTGYSIPLEFAIGGSVVFEIFGAGYADIDTSNYSGTLYFPDLAMIEDLKITYHEALDDFLSTSSVALEGSNSNSIGQNDYTIETSLCSAHDKDSRMGTLFYSAKKLPEMTAIDYSGYPEVITLARAEDLLFKSQRTMKLSIKRASIPNMKTRLTFDGSTWVLQSISSYDFLTCSAVATYLEI